MNVLPRLLRIEAAARVLLAALPQCERCGGLAVLRRLGGDETAALCYADDDGCTRRVDYADAAEVLVKELAASAELLEEP